MAKIIFGNLLESDCEYICHQVNCQGRMGSGIAKQIRERWPIVYDKYVAAYKQREDEVFRGHYGNTLNVSETLLGHLQQVPINDEQTVINIFAQQSYGYDGKRYTSYDAFWNCLEEIKKQIPKGSKIGFPWGIGCGLGGGNWGVIYQMIIEVLNKDYEVCFYRLEEEK